jgi:hypothetical protein
VATKFSEASHVAAVEATVARTNDQSLKNRLAETTKIDDTEARLKALIALREETERPS